MKAFDSAQFTFCDLCGQVIVGNSPQVIESNGLVTRISDLQISHLQCWHDTRSLEAQGIEAH